VPNKGSILYCPNMTSKDYKFRSEEWVRRFGVNPVEPGYVYVVESDGRFKIGRSKNQHSRIQAAKTWLPDIRIVGVKPFWNYTEIEKLMHIGFAVCWYEKEWFAPLDYGYRDTLVEGFSAFSDTDINRNSVDFVYWFNGEGMAEFVREQYDQQLSIKRFLNQETAMKKEQDRNKKS